MAEVMVSVDDEGATRGGGAAGEHQEIGATTASLPPVLGEQLPSLPPLQPPPTAVAPVVAAPREAPVTQPITPDEWVQEDDYWGTQSLIAVSGRLALPRPKSRPLVPPQRFRPVQRWQSVAALIVLGVVILTACIGTLRAVGFANNLLHPPQAVPTVTYPSTSPTATTQHN